VDRSAILSALREALERLGVAVRQEKMPEEAAINGGLCVIRGKITLIISPSMGAREKIELYASALRKLDSESIWLPPIIRKILDQNDMSSK
jgi:hypothetical protein